MLTLGRVLLRSRRAAAREAFESLLNCAARPALVHLGRLGRAVACASSRQDEDVRAALLAMRPRNPHLAIEGDAVTLELEGTEMVHENLNAIVDLLSRAPPEEQPKPYRANARPAS